MKIACSNHITFRLDGYIVSLSKTDVVKFNVVRIADFFFAFNANVSFRLSISGLKNHLIENLAVDRELNLFTDGYITQSSQGKAD